jgi:cytoskeletal protein CcmA (bactofilin family)
MVLSEPASVEDRVVATPDGSDASPGPDSGDGAVRLDASPLCQTPSPLAIPGMAICTGDLASTFRFAACACGSLNASGGLVTDALDSTRDAQVAGPAASIAANGQVAISAHTTLGGSIWGGGSGLQGSPAVGLHGDGTVTGSVQSGGTLDVGGPFHVGGDVFANGNVVVDAPDAGDSLSVSGAVHVPEGGTVPPSPAVTATGGVAVGPVTVPLPCDCSNLIPVFTIVSAFKTNNDNALIGLGTGSLENPTGPVHLPCGRYYVYGVTGGSIDLVVTGRVALFVDGDLNIDVGSLRIDLAPGAELDMFVAGSMGMGDGASVGNTSTPGRVRLYVAGAVQLGSSVTLGANVYAPNATFTSSSLEMSGALFAAQFVVSGSFAIHYDTAVLAATGCRVSGGTCQSCEDCSGTTPACLNGTCGACASGSDCCAPLVCSSGRCTQP